MNEICEFCRALRPIIYCKSDAARLCLSCDSKIHSANALSNRHSRTLLCESCRYRQAHIVCSSHRMFMCRDCNRSQHSVSSQHQRQEINSYIGCPSARDLAKLWGFDLNGLGDINHQDQFVSPSGCSSLTSEVDYITSFLDSQSKVGSGRQHAKAFYKGKQQDNTCFILQQIFDLNRLQLTEFENSPSLTRLKEVSSLDFDTLQKLENDLDQKLQQSLGLDSDLQTMDTPDQDLNVESFQLPSSQVDHFSTSSTAANPLHGDYFWQCKSPARSGQLWSQNMQDLGVCEEQCFLDDLSIPDVDVTFRNFEELFEDESDDQEASGIILDDRDMGCSCVEKETSIDKSDNGNRREIEVTSVASSIQSDLVDENTGPPEEARYSSRSGDFPLPMRPSYSTLSLSLSRLSGESSDPPITFRRENSYNTDGLEGAELHAKETVRTRYKEKKKKVQRFEKRDQYGSGRSRDNLIKRANSLFHKGEGYESDSVDVARSY